MIPMTASVAIVLLFAHFIGDSLCQTVWTYANKGQKNKALFLHTLEYGLILTPFVFFLTGDLVTSLIFATINSILHFFIDWASSRITLMENWKVHTRVIMHIDYILHLALLLLSFEVMFNAPFI